MGGKTENNASQRCGAFYIGFQKTHIVEMGLSIGADGGTLNPHLALRFAPRELVKPLSAPVGRCRKKSFLLSCGLKRFLAPNDLLQKKTHPYGWVFLLELMAGLEPATC